MSSVSWGANIEALYYSGSCILSSCLQQHDAIKYFKHEWIFCSNAKSGLRVMCHHLACHHFEW